MDTALRGALCSRYETTVGEVWVIHDGVMAHLTANKDGDWSAANRYHDFQRRQVEIMHAAVRRARTADTELMIVTGDFNIAGSGPLYPLIVGLSGAMVTGKALSGNLDALAVIALWGAFGGFLAVRGFTWERTAG